MSDDLKEKLRWMREIAIREPSEEELTAASIRRCSRTAPYSLQSLPQAALDLSVPTRFFLLSDAERQAVIDAWCVLNGDAVDGWDDQKLMLADLAVRLDEGIAGVGGAAFVRLGTRSPKDSYEIMDAASAARVTDGERAVHLLITSMERVFQDLNDDRRAGIDSYICIRQWVDIAPWQELRCFVEHAELVGISQYHCHDGPIFELIERRDAIEAAARSYLAESAMPALATLPSYTVDLIYDDDLRMTLLEVNPPITSGTTYPALFGEQPLDGSFQILAEAS